MAYYGTMPTANSVPYQHGRLDPAVPHFTPNGTELARFKPPTPPHLDMNLRQPSNDFSAMERYVVDSRTQHDAEIARLERRTDSTAYELEQTQKTYARDLQTLQGQIEMIRLQAGPSKNKDDATAALQSGIRIVNPQDVRPEVMLKHFDRDIVAQVYVEQAGVAEATAKKLRADALVLAGEAEKTEKIDGISILATPIHASERPAQTEKHSHAVEIKVPNEDIEKAAEQIETTRGPWQPLAVRNMKPSPVTTIPDSHTTTFTWEFLTQNFGGAKYSPSFYFISGKTSLLKTRGYWILEAEFEPFLPTNPGGHGAKLTPFFNDTVAKAGEAPDETNYLDTPVFISKVGQAGYTYFGHYSQLRFSDKLDYDRVMETVPENIRRYWANQLASPLRPAWVTKALKERFWPKPKYEGPIPTNSALATPLTAESGASKQSTILEKRVKDALTAYAEDLKQWEHDASLSVNCLTAEGLMKAFAAADADMEPGLRLWWEYFECVGYKKDFYEFLVGEQVKFEAKGPEALQVAAPIGAPGSDIGEADATPSNKDKDSGKEDSSEVQILDWEEDENGDYFAVSRPANTPKPAASTTASTIKPSIPKIKAAVSTPKAATPVQIPQSPAAKPNFPKGDLAAAKAFQATATPAKSRGSGGGAAKTRGGGMYTPPHKRAGK